MNIMSFLTGTCDFLDDFTIVGGMKCHLGCDNYTAFRDLFDSIN